MGCSLVWDGGVLGMLPRSLLLQYVVVLLVIHLVFSKHVLFSLPVLNRWPPCSNIEESLVSFGFLWL